MIKISYYKTKKDNIPKAFCMLAEKCYRNNISLFVYTSDTESTVELDKNLWSYSKKQFIPHGTIHDFSPQKQPILIGEIFENLNQASGIIIVNVNPKRILTMLSLIKDIERLFFLYDESEIAAAKDIKNVLSTSALDEFTFESYERNIDGSWVTR